MNIQLLARIITVIVDVLILVVILKVALSYFLPPYNQIRQILDKIVNPVLAPIQKIVPAVNGIDFSPVILIIVIQIIQFILLRIAYSVG